MLILRKVNTQDSFEVSWIYDRGPDGLFLKVEKAKGRISKGDKVTVEYYTPKLDKRITTYIMAVESNNFNSNICITLKNKKDITYFKKSLCRTE